jgi:hypothetical protein
MSTNQSNPSADPVMGFDPWGKVKLGGDFDGQIQDEDVFLGMFDMFVIIDTLPMAFYLRLPDGNCMELINVDAEDCIGLLARQPLDADLTMLEQTKQVLLEVFKAWSMYQWPSGLSVDGLITRQEWTDLKARLEDATRQKDSSEADDPHGLLKLVSDLGQEAQHHGDDSEFYFTRCPASHRHRIDLRPASGEWYCGWCPEGGKVPELRRFYKKHGHDL